MGLTELAAATRVHNIAPSMANVVILNVPGLRRRAYLMPRLVDVYPLSALGASIGLNVTFTPY